MTKRRNGTQNTEAAIKLDDKELEQVTGGRAGTGKVTLNPFTIIKKMDKASPILP